MIRADRPNVVQFPADPIEQAYRRVEREVRAAQEAGERFGGPCEKCKHYRSVSSPLPETFCHNPLVMSYSFDRARGLTVGKPVRLTTWIISAKADGVPPVCGDERHLFSPRPNFLRRLWDWFLAPWRKP